jgi:hypothetical protein
MPFNSYDREMLTELFNLVNIVHKEIRTMSSNVDQNFLALQAQVQQNVSVEQSAVTLIQGIAAQLAAAIAAANNGDSAALPALQQQLQTSATTLAAAVAANTPGSPATATPAAAPASSR